MSNSKKSNTGKKSIEKIIHVVKGFINFIDESVSVYHASMNVQCQLENCGYRKLKENERWNLERGGRYYVERNDTAVIAFAIPDKYDIKHGFRIIATHLDSPAIKLKLKRFSTCGNTNVIGSEVYGGAIYNTWLDKPLGVAGRLWRYEGNMLTSRLYNRSNSAIIPNPAIHFCRDINNGFKLNPERHLNACIGLGHDNTLAEFINESPNFALEESELFLYDCTPAALVGNNWDLINAPRLDNLASVFAALTVFEKINSDETIQVSFFADNEEIGSTTMQGADSNFLERVLRRIELSLGGDEEDYYVALAESLMVSADAAHAFNPNFPEYYEPEYAPQFYNGVVFKKNVSFKYATTGYMASHYRHLCDLAGIMVQDFTNRADMPCGSTVGPCLSAALGIDTLDVGVPLWAMHSSRETLAGKDLLELIKFFQLFLH